MTCASVDLNPEVPERPRAPGPTEAPERARELEAASAGIAASRRLGRVLRIVGGAFLIASASTFLLHRWEQGSDLVRYGMLLLHTVLLTAAALFCGLGVKESRGARTFLAITLAIVPINTTVLGGLVYSQFAQDARQVMLGQDFLWVAPNALAALTCVAVTAVVLAPAAWIAFRALGRSQATSLLLAFGLLNVLLLVPWRLPAVTTLLAVAATIAVAAIDSRRFRHAPAARTLEGRIARGTLLLPVVLLLGRGMHLYPNFLLEGGALLLSAGSLLTTWSRRTAQNYQRPLGALAVLSLASGWVLWWLSGSQSGLFSGAFGLPSLFLPLSALFIRAARSSQELGPVCRASAALLALLGVVPNLWLHPGLWTLLACASVGAVVVAVGAWTKSKLLTLGGLVAVVTAIAYQIGGNLELARLKHWAVLSGLGMLLIIVASYWERYQARILRRMAHWRALAREWDY